MLKDHREQIFEMFAEVANFEWNLVFLSDGLAFSSSGRLFGKDYVFSLTNEFLWMQQILALGPIVRPQAGTEFVLWSDADEEIKFELQKLFKKVNTDHINQFFEGKNV